MLEGTRVLIIDDMPAIVEMLSEFLKLNGCEVFKAYTGLEGMKILDAERIDIVLADVKLPDINGVSLLEKIKLKDPTIPVIMVTGYLEPDVIISSMKKGASDFILKPIEFDKLWLSLLRAKREKELLGENLKNHQSLEDKKKIMLLNRELQNRIKELTAMYRIATRFNAIKVGEDVFEKVLEVTRDVFEGRSVAYYTVDMDSKEIIPFKVMGEKEKMEKRIFLNGHLAKDQNVSEKYVELDELLLVPVLIKKECIGFLGLEKKDKTKEKTLSEDVFLLKLIAENASVQIENMMLYESLFESLMQTLNSLIISINRRDAYTQGHCQRVAKLSLRVATLMGIPECERHGLELVGPIHDLGKIGIPDSILLKPGRLTEEEYELMKKHPVFGEEILSRFDLLLKEARLVRYHHERYDGKGYPDHLSSDEIPIGARILAVCDSYDAMVTDRPYRKGMTREEALMEVKRCSGTQFDPEVVEAFLEIISGEEKSSQNWYA
ncbi:MAG: response regulator [Desulfobacterota bacterium]|nr:response regulator [Thermodesulfobacteriota bacterium]MDW8002572.1 response regulator [Deltaproteobacteria bacterium]